jgi:CYTH domain-containing protein/thymidylate kinase
MNRNDITKIALTGGPCAGKTTALVRIIEHFTSLGYQVFTLPEIPTICIQAGVNYLTDDRQYHYQSEKATLLMQMHIEDQFMEIAAKCGKPALVVCDRGTMDISTYLPEETWQALMNDIGTNTIQLRDSRYDAVLHLVSAANGAEEFYTTANNAARSEDARTARMLDIKLISAWNGHPHLRIIDNSRDFENKLKAVIKEISVVMGLPALNESQRNYVVEVIDNLPENTTECEITQTYLKSDPDTIVRLRKRGWDGSYVYMQSIKKKVSDTEFIETERQISPYQYVTLLQQADPSRKTLRKIRKNFVWEKQYFELDTFLDRDDGISILEIAGVKDPDAINFPPFVKVVRDVTGVPMSQI